MQKCLALLFYKWYYEHINKQAVKTK